MKHYVQLHLLVLLLAATALLGEVISLPAVGVVVWRTAVAAVGAAVWVALIRRLSLWPGAGVVGPLLGVGVIVGVHWISFFQAVKMTNVSICLAGLAAMPLFTALTEPWLEKRRVRPFEVLLGLLILAGVGTIAGAIQRQDLAGLAVALFSAFLAAIFPVLNRRLVTTGGDPLTMVMWEMLGALCVALVLLPFMTDAGSLFAWKGSDWLWLLALALGCTVFAHSFHIRLLKTLSAYTVNLAISFEPLYGIIAAALLFGEYKQLTPMYYVGLGTILIANIAHPVCVRMTRKPVM
ncbi:MAG: EamA family transporter [Akkermansiaceae bacterium]|nr:EamA family transporter [Akkermansiaceae bacterium]